MRHILCDQIAPIIAFHIALQSDSAVYSCLADGPQKRVPLKELGQEVARIWF